MRYREGRPPGPYEYAQLRRDARGSLLRRQLLRRSAADGIHSGDLQDAPCAVYSGDGRSDAWSAYQSHRNIPTRCTSDSPK